MFKNTKCLLTLVSMLIFLIIVWKILNKDEDINTSIDKTQIKKDNSIPINENKKQINTVNNKDIEILSKEEREKAERLKKINLAREGLYATKELYEMLNLDSRALDIEYQIDFFERISDSKEIYLIREK